MDTNIKSKYRIACIIHSLGIGGMERVMTILANYFSKKNAEVTILLIGRNRNIDFQLNEKIQIIKPNFEYENYPRILFTIKTLFFVRRTVKSIKPNVVLSFGEMWNNLVLLSMLGLKYPTYISDRSQPDKNLGRLHNFLRKTLYPRAHGIILQTKYATEFAKSKKRNKNIVKIGNPVRALKLPNVEKTNNIITVGRLIPTKNIDKLIELFSKINPDGWELTIIGGNAKKTNLLEIYRNQIKHLGMSNKINLLGKQNDVDYHLAKSKIFAFTSTSEGFPNALAEGMKAGCACIAFDCVAGPSDIIDDGINGFLIPENDYDEFQRKVEILIKDSKLRDKFGREAKTKMKNFEQTAIAESFFNFMLEHENSN